jgi:hypothetical protein
MGTGDSFSGGKAAGQWSWPFTSIYCRGQETLSYTNTPPICLHGTVLNYLNKSKNFLSSFLYAMYTESCDIPIENPDRKNEKLCILSIYFKETRGI